MTFKETSELIEALRLVEKSYVYLTDGVGTITDEAYLAVRSVLEQQTTQESSERSKPVREPSEAQGYDVFDLGADKGTHRTATLIASSSSNKTKKESNIDYVMFTSTVSTIANDPIDW